VPFEPTVAPLRPGDPARVGPCRLVGRLGQGGMGTVYLGVLDDDRAVAVKVLRDGLTDAAARSRFRRELDALRRVRGPHLVEVLDADVDAHHPWIVTRFVPGRRLDLVVTEDGPLEPAALDLLARGLAAALASLHAAGVVHRDITPGNVLLVDGEPHLIDLGLAVVADVTALTRSGTLLGTAGYLAPEQVQGLPATEASDVHAWGATLAMAGTGRPPYGTGRPEAVLYRVVHERPDLQGLSGPLADLIARSTDSDPARRPSATQLVAALGGASSAPTVTLHLRDLSSDIEALATAVLDLTDTRQLAGVTSGDHATTVLPQAADTRVLPPPPPPSQTRVLPPPQPAPTTVLPPTPAPAPPPPASELVDHVVESPPLIVRPGRLRTAFVAPPSAAALGCATALAPVVGLAGLLVVLAGLHAASRSRATRTVRRERRGVRRRDPALAALGAPWHLARGVADVVVGLPLAALVAAPVAAITTYAVSGQVTESQSQATGAGVGAVVLAAVLLWRRAAEGSRRLLGTAVLRATPSLSAGAFVVAALLAAGAVCGVLVQDAVHWLPLDGPPVR
jgi:serine/threonine protein kinase